MQIASTQNASPLPVTPATPGTNSPTGEDSPFAKILSAQKQPAARPEEVHGAHAQTQPEAKADASQSDAKSAEAADAQTAESEASSPPGAPRRGALRNAPKVATKGHEGKAQKADTHHKTDSAEANADKPTKEADKKDISTEPGAAELAAMNRPVTEPTAPPALGGQGNSTVSALPGMSAVPGEATAGKTAFPVDAAAQAAAGAARAPQDSACIDAGDAKRDHQFADVAAEVAQSADAARRASGEEKLDHRSGVDRIEQRLELSALREMLGSSHVAAPHHTPRVDSASAPVAVTLATPVTSPEFTEALGVQVSVLARDGVQHAELHLNPTDMGPISVQIALEGTRAQVDFGADSLATRQIIESGLPELASALRDAGFTLAGGGVSQHARQQQDREGGQQAGSGPRRVTASGDVAQAGVRRTTVRISQGGVDLYA